LWGFTAATGQYVGTVFVTNPTNGERMRLTPINAYILMIYCILKSMTDDIPEFIPSVTFRMIPKPQNPIFGLNGYPLKPNLTELKRGVSGNRLSDDFLNQLLVSSGDLYPANSPSIFGANVVKLHGDLVRRYRQVCMVSGRRAHVQAEIGLEKLYWQNVELPLASTPTTYANWLTLRGLNFDTLTPFDFQSFALDIARQATNDLLDRNRYLADLQSSALQILKQFTSYTSHVISSINRGNVLKLNPNKLRYEPVQADSTMVFVLDLRPESAPKAFQVSGVSELKIRKTCQPARLLPEQVANTFQVRRGSRKTK
jgi:hypothetical protein